MELCSTIFAIVGKFGVSGTFGVIYVHASELYPTPVRSIGVGIASAMGRVGGILAPLVASLGGFLPMIIFGSLGVLQVKLVNISQNFYEELRLFQHFGCLRPSVFL